MKGKQNKGRPLKLSGRREHKIDVRFTLAEFKVILDLEKSLGVKRTDLIRNRTLANSKNTIINSISILKELDRIGTEMGRSGNNINQLAKYANTLNRQGILSVVVAERFMILLDSYKLLQTDLEGLLRRVIRLM